MSKSMQDSRLHAKPLNPRIPLHRLVLKSSAVATVDVANVGGQFSRGSIVSTMDGSEWSISGLTALYE